jgi:uncharacterized heparinase superfamily protein
MSGRAGEALQASPVHRMRLAGPAPVRMLIHPKDLRPADRRHGQDMLSGQWRFGVGRIDASPDASPWQGAGYHLLDRLHRFDWLRDVAAVGSVGEARARSLTQDWLATFGRWDAFAWRRGPAADRQFNILCAGPAFWDGFDDGVRADLLDCLARQARHLAMSLSEEGDPLIRFRMTSALCLSGLCLEDFNRTLEHALPAFEKECASQILADGGHASRSPEALCEALIDIQTIEEALLRAGLNAPAFLLRLQSRMAPMLAFLQAPDGGLVAAHGGGEGRGRAAAALAPYGGISPKFMFAMASGYQKVRAGDLHLIMDSGGAPARPFGARAHASTLAFSMYDGSERVVVSCGADADLDPVLREAARRTAAHSVLCLAGSDASVFALDPSTGLPAPEGPPGVAVKRLEENDEYLVEGQHGGWRIRHGLIYRRRLYVEKTGSRVTGEDSLARAVSETAPAAPGDIPFAIRFHLHPDVQIAEGADAKTVYLGLPAAGRAWRFRSSVDVAVETSRYWSDRRPRRTAQLVLRGRARPDGQGSEPANHALWSFTRLSEGGD